MISISFSDNVIRVVGEIDIFCADQLRQSIKEHGFDRDFIVDLTDAKYIDSSGIGVFISLFNYFEKLGFRFYIQPSESLSKIFKISKLDTLFFKEEKTRSEAIVFHDSFEADTKVLSFIIDKLFKDLDRAGYGEEEAQEIVVAVDEAITNAVLETIKCTGEVEEDLSITFKMDKVKAIAVRWEISDDNFYATIIDHGSGLDLKEVEAHLPEASGQDYLNQVGEHQQKGNIRLRLNGEEIELKRLGAGLKIMASFMDTILIDLIDAKKSVSDKVTRSTLGTILNLYRARRKLV